ncbi:hypothetical protein L3Q82_014168 [Scortum barcoo]|uniref:Uncharacterized protein n=1 Tax=Scortum barcoo TaxID=214431 RepID=A0ACB8VW07_9TELE|nr:hypothetical protein L3Q82_014168 [Scortum barcoo]
MDPADPGAITKALSAQGIIVGKHDSQIQEMVDTLRDLSNSMARMQTQLSLLTPGSAGSEGTPPGLSSSLAAGSTVSTPREPFVPTPESYAVYHDLAPVFSKAKATSLPPHRPYDCPIDLLPDPPHLHSALDSFFVEKKDKTLRQCIDFRGLNDITIKNKYPLPLIDPAFEPFHQATIFSKLDLRNAYHLVRIREPVGALLSTAPGHSAPNTKPDALSPTVKFSLDTSPPSEPASILPPSCIVGAASWDIETRVQEALKDHPAPNNCPKDRLFVPSNLRSLVLQWIHTSKFSCHPGIRSPDPLPSFSNASGGPGWPRMAQDTQEYINACLCLCPWQILSPCSSWVPQTPSYSSPPLVLVSYCCGLVSGLPPSQGNTVILTVVDRFSKVSISGPLPSSSAACCRSRDRYRLGYLLTLFLTDRGFPCFSGGQLFAKHLQLSCPLFAKHLASNSGQTLACLMPWASDPGQPDRLRLASYGAKLSLTPPTGMSPRIYGQWLSSLQPPLFPSQEEDTAVPSIVKPTSAENGGTGWSRPES